jgi:hypothetical protein
VFARPHSCIAAQGSRHTPSAADGNDSRPRGFWRGPLRVVCPFSEAEVLIWVALDPFLRLLRDAEESGRPVPKFSRLQEVLGLAMSTAST